MKKIIKHITALLLATTMLSGCAKFLDVVPDEAKDTDLGKYIVTGEAARGYLYSCYAFLPNQQNSTLLDYLTTDEVVAAYPNITSMYSFSTGRYSPANPVISYWENLYKGIRQCYLFRDVISKANFETPAENALIPGFIDEVDFLIAYYHYVLLKHYGPIIIVDKMYNSDAYKDKTSFLARTSYDESVNWIVTKLDEAAKKLPPTRPDEFIGRATSVTAKALKARILLYAASPLFNGGGEGGTSLYSNFKNKDGKQLISATYDAKKWSTAALACKEAIDAAEAAGYKLNNKSPLDTGTASAPYKYPTDPIERVLRYTMIDNERNPSSESILVESRRSQGDDYQNKCSPRAVKLYGASGKDLPGWNGVGPTLQMVEQFYTKNGLPIDEDPEFDYASRYSIIDIDQNGTNTLYLNTNREPRFNAWIAYHNGNYEVKNGGKAITKLKMMFNQLQGSSTPTDGRPERNFSYTGYLNKKGVSPANITTLTGSGNSVDDYLFPIIRLTELYLNYAEALIEEGNDFATAKMYIDKVRKRAGLPTIDQSWAKSKSGLPTTKDALRKIVRQERTIELYLERHRFWDVRRWMIGEQTLGVQAKGLNRMASTEADFFKIQEVPLERFFDRRNYLLPIKQSEVDRNPNMVQNPFYN